MAAWRVRASEVMTSDVMLLPDLYRALQLISASVNMGHNAALTFRENARIHSETASRNVMMFPRCVCSTNHRIVGDP
jgi:hypothetical protein